MDSAIMTDPVVISIPHRLGRAEARRRLEAGIDQIVAPLGRLVSIERRVWTDDRLDFGMSLAGQTARGLVDVEDTHVRIELELPWFLAAIAKRAKSAIDQHGRVLLEKK
jgi:Putative polyhydroxyalkanoic acid system protein (PHA_gran_rgn)